ncbi:MAG: YhcH/YjgK/YiaL family protein [Elusimicrobia bacterium]|nr:YhcH/YjgK/YiaL family protein [Elusimicrobiota bacterium]
MIVAHLKHADRQSPGAAGLSKAFAFLRRPDLAGLGDGRYPIEGDRVYALVQRYATAGQGAEPRFEAHRDFIDVQYVLSGSEVIGWAPLSAVEVSEPYDAEKDVCFGRARGWTPVRLGPGELAVLYPEDAHAPRLADGAPGPVAKVVVKVSVADGI